MSKVYSHSQLESFDSCPKRFAYRYVWRTKVTKARGVEGYLGNVVHGVIERTFHHFALHDRFPKLDTLLKRFASDWLAELPSNGLFVARRGRDVASYEADGRRGLARFHELLVAGEVDPRPAHVEHTINFSVAGRDFVGVVDYLGPRSSIIEVRDWKSGKPKTVAEARLDPQLALYEIGLRQTYHDACDYALVHEYLTGGTTVMTERTSEDLQALEDRVGETCSAIEHEQTWRAQPSGLCGWCDYSNQCTEARR